MKCSPTQQNMLSLQPFRVDSCFKAMTRLACPVAVGKHSNKVKPQIGGIKKGADESFRIMNRFHLTIASSSDKQNHGQRDGHHEKYPITSL